MTLFPWQQTAWQNLFQHPGRIPHALLLEGPKGQGKLHFAKTVAQSLLCLTPDNNHVACQTCQSCLWLSQKNHPDFILIGAEEDSTEEATTKRASGQILIDQIRALDDIVYQTTHSGKPRVVIIDQADKLHTNAANAFLKKLEEPSEYTRYILTTAKKHRLLPTILSRCQAFYPGIASEKLAIDWLVSQNVKEAQKWFHRARSPLEAKALAEAGIDLASELMDAFLQYRKDGAIFLAEHIEKNHVSKKSFIAVDVFISVLQKINYDLILLAKGLKLHYHPDKITPLQSLGKNCHIDTLMLYEQQLLEYRKEALHPLNTRLFLETILLDCPYLSL